MNAWQGWIKATAATFFTLFGEGNFFLINQLRNLLASQNKNDDIVEGEFYNLDGKNEITNNKR